MTAEEIEIIVTAKIEEALKEFNKIVPAVKEKMKQVQDSFSKINTQGMKNKLQQAVNFVKNKLQNIKESSEKSKIDLKVTNEDAKKQISQIQKQIDSLQEKINARQMKLNVINPQIDKMIDDTKKSVTPKGINPNDKAMDATVNNALNNNKDFTSLSSQAQKLYAEIEMYNKQLDVAKSKMVELNRQTSQTANSQNKIVNAIGNVKSKIDQAKTETNSFKNSFNQMTKISQTIKSNIKNISSGMKNGLKHVLAYAGALFSLRGIYSLLSSSAQTWLSSQNAGAKQLSANIDYMKYAMGSALAPVIQFVTNLVYQLMKAIQSVAYALTGVNIFAKASASSYSSMAKNAGKAKDATKQLAGVHSEINNVQTSKSGSSGGAGTPSFDLSGLDNTPNSIIDAIKNGNWYEVGSTIGQKLNEAMDSIPWDKIQDGARKIGTNIAQFINGFIATTDWNQVGNTFAQGLNTIIYFGYSFITTFNWGNFGQAIGNAINGFFQNVDWAVAGQTLSDGIKGILDIGITALKSFDPSAISNAIVEFITNVDWLGVAGKTIELALMALVEAFVVFPIQLGMAIGEKLKEGIDTAVQSVYEKIKENGGNVMLGLLEGIAEIGDNIGQWVIDHIFQPFIDGFKEIFGIHSPSTVMAEMGGYLVEGLKNGISDLWNRIKSPFEEFGNNVSSKFNEIKGKVTDWANNTKTTVSNWGNNVKSKVSECWTNASNTVRDKVNTLKTNISTGLNNARSTISGWGDNIKSTFTNLGKNAATWGKDLVENMASGIRNNVQKVGSAVQGVASKIKGLLGFSEPEEGPLSNFHTYMPDMIDLMVAGIKSNTNRVKSEIEDLAGMMSYTINTDRIVDIPQINSKANAQEIKSRNSSYDSILSAISDMNSNDNNDRPIYLTIKVGDRTLGEILLNDLRNIKRQTGKDIEAIVGD